MGGHGGEVLDIHCSSAAAIWKDNAEDIVKVIACRKKREFREGSGAQNDDRRWKSQSKQRTILYKPDSAYLGCVFTFRNRPRRGNDAVQPRSLTPCHITARTEPRHRVGWSRAASSANSVTM